MGKRKDQCISEPEGSRKRRKASSRSSSYLLLGALQLACLLDREFIKEHSTTHPESSGLKAATKAASDAWKLMGPEEKSTLPLLYL